MLVKEPVGRPNINDILGYPIIAETLNKIQIQQDINDNEEVANE